MAAVFTSARARQRRPWWGESEREGQGESGRVQAVRGDVEVNQSVQGQSGKQLVPWRALAAGAASCLPVWQGRSSWLARASIVLGRQVDLPGRLTR